MAKKDNQILLGSFEDHEGDIPDFALGRPSFSRVRKSDLQPKVRQTKVPCNRIRITKPDGHTFRKATTKAKVREHFRASFA